MKRAMKQLCAVLCAAVMLTAMLPTAAFTASAITSGDFEYVVLTDEKVKITAYNGYAETLTVPAELDGYTVTTIGELAFEYCDSLTSVYYNGTEQNRSAMTIGDGNGYLTSATWHYSRLSADKLYPDVKANEWYFEAVDYVSAKEYMTGFKNGKFGPADNLQRQDFVLILARVAGVDLTQYEGQNGGLSDVPKGAYYAPAVAWGVKTGIITGYKNGKFGVGDPITREQVCTILYRYVGENMLENVEGTLAQFADKVAISDFARTPVAWAVQNGVMSGMTAEKMAPTANASRAQIATIVMRMEQKGLL